MVEQGQGAQIEKWMDTPLSTHGADPTKSLSAGAQELIKQGLKDGADDDDKKITGKFEGDGTFVPVLKLLASQNEVGKAQSLKNVCAGVNGMEWDGIDYGDVEWLVDAMKPGAQITFKSALLGAKTSDGNVVLDGHHRWSQLYAINKTAKIVAYNFTNPDIKKPLDALKAAQIAIIGAGATKVPRAVVEGKNLLKMDEAALKEYVINNTDDGVVDEFAKRINL